MIIFLSFKSASYAILLSHIHDTNIQLFFNNEHFTLPFCRSACKSTHIFSLPYRILRHLTDSYRILPISTDWVLGIRPLERKPSGYRAETERIISGSTGASPIVKKPFQSAEIDESKRGICINTYKKAQRQRVAGLEFWTNSYGSFWWNLN